MTGHREGTNVTGGPAVTFADYGCRPLPAGSLRGKVAFVPRGRGRAECSGSYSSNGVAGVGYTQRAKIVQVRSVCNVCNVYTECVKRVSIACGAFATNS